MRRRSSTRRSGRCWSITSWRTPSRSTWTRCATRGRDHRRHHAAHRRGRHPLRRLLLRAARREHPRRDAGDAAHLHAQAGSGAQGGRPGQFAVRHSARRRGPGPRLRDRGEPARLAHRALCLEGDRHSAGQDCRAADDRPQAARTAAGATCQRQGPGNRHALLREVAGLSLVEVCRRGYGAGPGDEVHRRGDGRGGHLWRGLCQGAAFGRAGAAHRRHGLLQRQRPRQAGGVELARRYVDLGFKIVATEGTANVLERPASAWSGSSR
jgi:hypothetical protein